MRLQTGSSSFCFYLVPGFSLVALSCAIDVLRAANVEVDKKAFQWCLGGSSSTNVVSSSGLSLAATALTDLPDCDVIAICGGDWSHLFQCRKTDIWLRQQASRGKVIGSFSDGAYVAAKAGLFDNCRSTIHWKCQSAYRERFPALDVRISILEIDGNRFSCAGGTSSLDLMLNFVLQTTNPQVVGKIADNYFHDVIRGDDQVQHITSALRFAARNKPLGEALMIMENNLEHPILIGDIAQEVGVTRRQLNRLFKRYLRTSPVHHYRDMRLARASAMLKQTGLSVGEIALGCGFQSASHLSRHFKETYGHTPSQQRRVA